MRNKAFIIIPVLGICAFTPLESMAQQTDPTLTAAVILQTEELKSAYKKRNETQNKLIAAQAAVATAMEQVHGVENKILEYMSNASSAMNDIYQLKRAAELVSTHIPNQLAEMSKAVPDNLKGTAITALTSKTVSQVTTEMASLYGLMSQLVTSTKYSFNDGKDDTSGKKNVNLLSAAERYYIATEVTGRLERIYRKLYNITYQIKTLDWMDAWYNLDSSSWAKFQNGKTISQSLMTKWDKMKK
ncbi:MAG: hypothetical protein J1E95_01605 [Muribaculaceae bacterium]|nr:hypothetical protein [Muribaculaceae bacterium]